MPAKGKNAEGAIQGAGALKRAKGRRAKSGRSAEGVPRPASEPLQQLSTDEGSSFVAND